MDPSRSFELRRSYCFLCIYFVSMYVIIFNKNNPYECYQLCKSSISSNIKAICIYTNITTECRAIHHTVYLQASLTRRLLHKNLSNGSYKMGSIKIHLQFSFFWVISVFSRGIIHGGITNLTSSSAILMFFVVVWSENI